MRIIVGILYSEFCFFDPCTSTGLNLQDGKQTKII